MWWMSGHMVMIKLPVTVAHSRSLLNHPNSLHGRMLKLNTKPEADSLLYSLSHFACDGHIVHILTQQCLSPPLTSTVKPSLLVHAHSNPLFLAARLHRCHTNPSSNINDGWTFSRQASCICLSSFLSLSLLWTPTKLAKPWSLQRIGM